MSINSNIFKSYDIRGVYPQELKKETAYKIGKAFVRKTGAKKIIGGHDMRISSEDLFRAMVEGIIDSGADFFDLGLIPTELIYFSLANGDYDAGFMTTASHNPKDYNGFKIFRKENGEVLPIRGKDFLEIIENKEINNTSRRGRIKKIDFWQNYLDYIFSFIKIEKIKPFKIVVDASNGMAGKIIPFLADSLPLKIISLNFQLDGNFPSHSPNPLEKGSADEIRDAILDNKADFGFIFDGDADRIFLVDEKGNLLRADITILFLIHHFLNKYPGKGIVYNLICSKAVPEFIKKWGGIPLRSKVGFVNVSEKMRKEDGVMGGEVSGHYSYKDYFYLDSAGISFLVLLQSISIFDEKVSKLSQKFSPYFKASEENFKVKDKEKVLELIREKFSNGRQDYLDGVTIEFSDWWFNIRPSQTEPLLRLNIEANSKELLEEKKEELSSFIKKYSD